ncbi:unnamed protein product [Aspergillus oryzae]|uniref:Unnamed protein product n=2 Tax=Aspergillus oryzae TaxID=5062 RepID=A0AAN5BLZ7_ASPOZ|nr:unnamed protein product [Aspergillus oryzae]GMF86014.1 unnamed protein product [Aspergillus oryzae]GMG14194.1 unnamed protein product [Aspergillus oryzae]GMG22604.1 unnamed protein product [Aspergillus oryzae]GMG46905.1 unnamed protein product [Aspergillus oryzae var. brunneus]
MGGWGADDGAAGWENAGDIATYNDENANPSGNFKDDGFGGNAWENTSAGNEQNDDNKCRKTIDCKENRKFDLNNVPDKLPEEAWAAMQKASEEKDLEDFREPVGDCISVINLQGKLDCKYVVGFYYSPKPQRANLKERWPESVEENLERLEDAGIPYDREIPKCSNCGGNLYSRISSKEDS